MTRLLSPVVAVALGAALVVAHGQGTRERHVAWTCPKTAVLTALPAIGTIEWRSRDWSHEARFSLGIHLFDTASTEVRFRSGHLTAIRSVEPGDPTKWFRYSTNRVQWLAAGSGGEGGDVIGVVRVDFAAAAARRVRSQDCWIFYPPRLTVRFYGHQPLGVSFPHGGFGGMLRPWPIR